MTKTKDSTFFENKLLDFIAEPDPLFSMMQWLTVSIGDIFPKNSGRAFPLFWRQKGRDILMLVNDNQQKEPVHERQEGENAPSGNPAKCRTQTVGNSRKARSKRPNGPQLP